MSMTRLEQQTELHSFGNHCTSYLPKRCKNATDQLQYHEYSMNDYWLINTCKEIICNTSDLSWSASQSGAGQQK